MNIHGTNNNTSTYCCQYGNAIVSRYTRAYDQNMSFIEKLVAAMRRKKFSDYDLETESGVPQPTIYRIRTGKQKPALDTVIKLAAGLSMSVGELVDDNIGETAQKYDAHGKEITYPLVIGIARISDSGYFISMDKSAGHIEFKSSSGSVAIQIKGHAYHPAIKDGWFIVVDNDPADVGDYVLLTYNDGRKTIKELIKTQPDGYLLFAINRDERNSVCFSEIASMQPISAIVSPGKYRP